MRNCLKDGLPGSSGRASRKARRTRERAFTGILKALKGPVKALRLLGKAIVIQGALDCRSSSRLFLGYLELHHGRHHC
jgi:hypothetical protein